MSNEEIYMRIDGYRDICKCLIDLATTKQKVYERLKTIMSDEKAAEVLDDVCEKAKSACVNFMYNI